MTEVKYEHPSILLIDLPVAVAEELRQAGYSVTEATFGRPYLQEQSTRLFPIATSEHSLIHLSDFEIVLAWTGAVDPDGRVISDPADGIETFWSNSKRHCVDQRPFIMNRCQPQFDRILNAGGIVVLFLDYPYEVRYSHGFFNGGYPRMSDAIPVENSVLVSKLLGLDVKYHSGRVVNFVSKDKELSRLTAKGFGEGTYNSVIPSYKDDWVIATNNSGEVIARWHTIRNGEGGNILVLPPMEHLSEIVVEFIGSWCQRHAPHLFPFHTKQDWLHAPEYELPEVTALQKEVEEIVRAAKESVAEAQGKIDQIRSDNAPWYTLLNGTGDELVDVVKSTLEDFGFSVIDVDELLEAEGEVKFLREDLRIDAHGDRDELVIDVKGVNGIAEDAEAVQSEKHARMRGRETKRYVKPLTIINAEKNIPPRKRNSAPYRNEIVQNAEQTGLGLMTTYDLHLLLRNKSALKWSNDVIQPIFYRSGRIEPIPEHYVELGAIVKFWPNPNVIGVILQSELKSESKISVLIDGLFTEYEIDSLQINEKPSKVALPGSDCGIKLKSQPDIALREGLRVFRVDDLPRE